MILQGDCIEKMKELEENSIDALVSDPPYGLAFMNKEWDDFKPRAFQEFSFQWGEQALRILKPGAWVLAFSGTRTYHRMVCGLEDAGFAIRDQLAWMYGAGFPKSLNISKAIEKHLGIKPIGKIPAHGRIASKELIEERGWNNINNALIMPETQTPEAKQWEGWGSALKPALEPIVLAQKPREGTFAENVLKWSVGGLNIDACRINYSNNEKDSRIYNDDKNISRGKHTDKGNVNYALDGNEMKMFKPNKGRYPSNVLLTHHPECKIIGMKEVGSGQVKHNQEITRKGLGNHCAIFRENNSGFDVNKCQGLANYGVQIVPAYECHPDCPVRLLDEQSGILKSGAVKAGQPRNAITKSSYILNEYCKNSYESSKGGGSRFFYSGKAHKSERNTGLNQLEHVDNTEMVNRKENSAGINHPRAGAGRGKGAKNDIATLKPINLMRYLVRLVCPKGGTVIDPFAGSGTTGIACIIEGMNYILIEKRERFANIIIPKRLDYWKDPAHWDVLNDHNALPELKIMKNKKQFKDIRSFGGRE